MLVAFLSGNAAVGRADDRTKWWFDTDIQERLRLTPQQVQALDEIYTEAEGKGHTQMLWRMYQTLTHAAAAAVRAAAAGASCGYVAAPYANAPSVSNRPFSTAAVSS